MSLPNEPLVQPALTAVPRLRGLRRATLLLHVVALLAGVLALVLLAFSFKFLADGLAIAWGHTRGAPTLLPLSLATLGSWSVMYLLHDHLGILGSATARRLLYPVAQTRAEPGMGPWHFVELRPHQRRGALRSDWGWLLFYADRLEFVGEHQHMTIPRRAVPVPPRAESTLGGLLPSWLVLPVHGPLRDISLLARDSANTLSATATDAQALRASLTHWLDTTPIARTNQVDNGINGLYNEPVPPGTLRNP